MRRLLHRPVALLPIVALAILLPACDGGDDDSSSDGKVKVVTSLPLFADFVREVAGDRVEVTSLVPAGADPHTWEPSPSDVRRVAEADIAFANGLDLEPAAIRVLEANLPGGVSLIRLAEEAEAAGAELFHYPEGAVHDPHIFMNIQNGKAYAEVVRIRLTELDPAGEADYARNARSYFGRIDETERYAFERLDSIPPENKKLISTHNAFGYFGGYFAIELTAALEDSPGQEPTPEDVARITRMIEDRNVLAVFTEPQISEESEMLRQAAEDAGARVCTLYSDSLDDRVTSYIELMRFNANELFRCLGGEDGS